MMDDFFAAFAQLASAVGQRNGGDPNIGAVMPRDDADDLARGARVIPDEVTEARRQGLRCTFVQPNRADQSTWFWHMPNGSNLKHGVWT